MVEVAAKHRIVIIGAGQAGARCAESLRLKGHTGPITILGDEQEPPYERPPLSKSLLAGLTNVESHRVLPLDWYLNHQVSLRLGSRVEYVDRLASQVIIQGGSSLPYDKLVFATGSRPRLLGQGAWVLRSVQDSLDLSREIDSGRRLLIVGAGLIGLEVAATARSKGMEVTLIEAANWPMVRVVPRQISQYLVELHKTQGVHWVLDARIAFVDETQVKLEDGTVLVGDVVLVAIGVMPNDDLARTAGLPTDDGILVDEFGCTADAAIYATGDCARLAHHLSSTPIRIETWQHSELHPQTVASAICGDPKPYREVPWAWSDQYGVNLQMSGWTHSADAEVWRGDPSSGGATLFMLQHASDDQFFVIGATSINRSIDQRSARRLISKKTLVSKIDISDLNRSLP